MGKPKKQTSPRKTGLRRSRLVLNLARRVNGILSQKGEKVKVYTTKRESGKASVAAASTKKIAAKKAVKKAA
jgi:hypothetical protein